MVVQLISFILRGCMDKSFRLSRRVQNEKFRASFLKKKSVLYLTIILLPHSIRKDTKP